jgi:hypothetical protein
MLTASGVARSTQPGAPCGSRLASGNFSVPKPWIDTAKPWAAKPDWPAGKPVAAGIAGCPASLRFAAGDASEVLVATLLGQLQRAGIAVERLPTGSGEPWDLRLVRTHGAPYDPFTIVERFGRPASHPTAATANDAPIDEALATAIDGLLGASDPASWPQHFARIQTRLDELLPVVPLFAPRRLAIVGKGAATPKLDLDLYRLDPGWLAQSR